MKNAILKKGFTLIELLVVVSIIAVLASVILASLNNARGKGADAAVKSNLANIRPQAGVYADNNTANPAGTATAAVGLTSCTTANTVFMLDPNIAKQITAATAAGSGLNSCMNSTGAAGTWAVTVQLKTNNTLWWCVDSNGASRQSGITGTVQGTGDNVVAGAKCN